jgi:hypothetical protein
VASDKPKPGRVTPKKSTTPPAKATRRSVMPDKVGPFARPNKDAPLGQVGRRPSSPGKLLFFAVVYLVCGTLSFFVIKGTLGIILGIVLIGVGLLWFRGAATAQLRLQKRQEEAGEG